MNESKHIVVGAGFFGSVVARRIAEELNEKVLVIDKRDHIGGNSYAYIDEKTGIEVHKYGSHIFHTSDENVWNYINKFTEFNNFIYNGYSNCNGCIYHLPINLHTINQFFNKDFSPSDAKKILENEIKKEKLNDINNLEDKAVSFIGRDLYNAFIRDYVKKQWATDPKNLPPEIIMRLPFRLNYNNNYYNDKYQGIPKDGYEKLFEKILSHKNIKVELKTDFKDIKDKIPRKVKVIYTGAIDELCDYKFGFLAWRSLRFEFESKNISDFQGTAVMAYPSLDVSYTRIHEFKHYHPEWDSPDKTIICKEYPMDYNIGVNPYYPINNKINDEKYLKYLGHAKDLYPNFVFGGRLGSYKYLDMDRTILDALNLVI